MKLLRTKTDKADAKIICSYGKEQSPDLWQPKEEAINLIQQKLSTQELFIKQLTAFKNKLEALNHNVNSDKGCIRMVKQEIRNIETKIKKLDSEIETMVIENYENQYKLLKTIPGIGRKTAATLIAITGGFKNFDNHRS
jgi:transposase